MRHLLFWNPGLILSILLVAIGALAVAYRKLRLRWFLSLVASLVLVPTAAWKYQERQWVLQRVPDALDVHDIAYRNEESWGFGPGGNEAGIVFYALPEDVARQVKEGGVGYLETLPPNADQQRRDWRGRYDGWAETPITGDRFKVNPDTGLLNVAEYICAYGFCIDIPRDRLQQANEIASRPGSFYAQGRVGIIVVSPGARSVIYFCNG
jgi:hypothetical protein